MANNLIETIKLKQNNKELIEKCIDERPTWGFYRFPVEDINKFNNDSPNWDFFNAIIAIYNEAGFKAYVEPQYVYENS